jgi:signal peptidase I
MKTFSNEEILKIKDPHKEDRELLKFCLILFAVFVIISSLFTANFINVKVVGASMENTLHNGDVLCVQTSAKITYGDIIIIDNKKPNEYIVKRVIGLGGDTITIKQGEVYRNGKLLDENSYVKKINGVIVKTSATGGNSDFTIEKSWVLKENEIFFLGDNRINSTDSRSEAYGPCLYSDVIGVIPDWSYNIKNFTTAWHKAIEKVKGFFLGGSR